MRVHHVGYLVKNIQEAENDFKKLHAQMLMTTTYDSDRQAYMSFLDVDGYVVELVCPDKDSNLYPLLKKYKNSPYHMCYEVENLQESISEMEAEGFVCFNQPEEAKMIDVLQNTTGCKVAFMMSSSIGMVELLQIPE